MFKPELLAPAGSLKTLKAAINTGADAVYFGLSSFSARSSAVNFTHEEAEKGFSYLKMRGKKGYVALNTLVKDNELNSVKEELKFLASVGADGVIVQDPGIAYAVKQCVPDMPLHASTQMTVHNKEGVDYLKSRGVERVVLSRELPLKDIEYIKKNTDCELEIFIHGALCVSYSGQCYMSSFIGERSGNRGKCAQPCRLPYQMSDKKGTLLSLKDMESTNYINKIKELEIESLKIEGRLKNEYYTAVVVDSYRKLLDGYTLSKEEKQMLFDIFNRGGYTSYFDGRKEKMFCYNKQEIPYSETELKAEEKYKNIIADEKIPESTAKTLNMKLALKTGEYPVLTGETDQKTVTVYGDEKTEKAMNNPISTERIIENLSKLGQTPFKAGDITVECDEDVFVKISSVNQIRRKLIEELSENSSYEFYDLEFKKGRRETTDKLDFVISVTDNIQYNWAKNKGAAYIIAPVWEVVKDPSPDLERTVISIPPVITLSETDQLKQMIDKASKLGIKYALAENISHLEFLKDFELIAGSRLNIANSTAPLFLPEFKIATISKELNLKDAAYVLKSIPAMVEGYGYQSMMLTENCIKKCVNGKCIGKLSYLKDRKGSTFPVVCSYGCRNEILNSVPLVISDKLSSLKKSGINYLLLKFTFENPEECETVYQSYLLETNPFTEFTRGHFFRGVQ